MKQVFYNSNGTRYKRALAWKQVFYNSNGTRYKRALAKQVFYNSNGTRYKRALARILIAVYDVKTGRSLRQSGDLRTMSGNIFQ